MIASRRRMLAAALIFAGCATLYTLLGLAVSHAPPRGLDAAARDVTGEFPQVAWTFTASCLWPVLTTFGLAGSIVARRAPAWRGRIIFAIVTTVVTWQVSNVLKDIFMRPRPAYWIVHRETTYSYSSGHAMFAVLVYWLWAYHLARSDAPAAIRLPIVALLTAWGAGVVWSRLALGAHYPSDLAGGILLAVAMLAAATLVAALGAARARVW